jgi:hypothetical protein
MSAKKDTTDSKSTRAPIKRLVLRRETVRELSVRTGVRGGLLVNPYTGVASGGSGSNTPTTTVTTLTESQPSTQPTSIIITGSG